MCVITLAANDSERALRLHVGPTLDDDKKCGITIKIAICGRFSAKKIVFVTHSAYTRRTHFSFPIKIPSGLPLLLPSAYPVLKKNPSSTAHQRQRH
jgi:hypothetical protein